MKLVSVISVFLAVSLLSAPKEDINHKGIIESLDQKAFEKGKNIYKGLCINCHGDDGKTAPLPTARAFGAQPFKFGNDPYSIYKTLTNGNGLMGPMIHLSPAQRYQVAHYIREEFVKSTEEFAKITDEYLNKLPKGKGDGEFELGKQRDYGPGLASQLGKDISNVMTVKLGSLTLSYNLHSMNQAGLWSGGFLNLNNTQHMKLRGGGTALPAGKNIAGLQGWEWAHNGTFDYSKENLPARGPMPKKWLDYKGHYLHGNKMIFSYLINGRKVLELPEEIGGSQTLSHTLKIGPGKSLKLCVAKIDGAKGSKSDGSVFTLNKTAAAMASFIGSSENYHWEVSDRLVLNIPASAESQTVRIIRSAGKSPEDFSGFKALIKVLKKEKKTRLDALLKGGPLRWAKILTTAGKTSSDSEVYALDTLTAPKQNPWNSWFRTSALDFFSDGRMAVTTHGGDVWIVSGIDKQLKSLKWKRYAAGLYEPFGIKIVNDVIYVTCKDRLTRLHDFNDDGEADYYESFYSDYDVSTFFHAYNFDLQTDSKGNFYYAKAGQYTSHALPGAIVKVPPEGGRAEIYATGLRTPNGMGITNDDRLTVSDNEGNWMPASKINLLKKDGFYGYVQTHEKPGSWAPDGGKINPKKVVPPETFDPPLLWIPRKIDNSSGGQLWVDDKRWGPLSGRMIHTSFGQGRMYYLMIQNIDGISQGALVRLSQMFTTGIMRARVNPGDGQVYTTGLNGWNGGGRKGLGEGGIQRLRYTGKDYNMVNRWKIEKDGIKFGFNFSLNKNVKPNDIKIEQWNYKWAHSYGSKEYKLDGTVGRDEIAVEKVNIGNDGKSLKLIIPGIQPINQIYVKLKIKTASGENFNEEIWMTVSKVPN